MEASRTQPAMERGGASLPEQGTGFPTASGQQEEDCKDPEVHGAETGSCARQESHEAMPITPLLDDTWKDDPAVLGWMVQPGEPLEEEGWHMEDPEQVLPQPVPYHELLWRDWEDLCDPETPSDERFDFTVLSYNILSQDLVDQNRELYLHCAPAILCWEYRWRSILQELQHWEADVLCLQEVQEDHYRKEVQRSLSAMGYSCHYKRRTGRKTDGCCTCYKTQRFMLLCQSHVEFFRPGIDQLNRDNVGLVLLLQPLPTAGLPDGRSFPPLCVANTHLLYNPRRGDIKLAQLALFLAEVDKVARTPEGSHCPIILCGDLNATPDSPLYRLLRYGSLNCRDLPAWKVSGQEKYCSYPYPRILPSPLWPDFLGVTDHCRYSSLHVPKGSGHAAAERLSYTRQRLLQLRYCLAACQRPPNLALIKGVTDNEPDPHRVRDHGLNVDPVKPPRESDPVLHVAPTEPPRDPVLHVAPAEPPRESDPVLHVAPTEPPCESDPVLHVAPTEPPCESDPGLHVAPTEPPRDPVLHVAPAEPPRESDPVLHVAPTEPPRDPVLHVDPAEPPRDPVLHVAPAEPPRESDPVLHVAPTEPPRDPVLHVDPAEPPRDPVLHVAPTEPPRESEPGLHVAPTEPPCESDPGLHVAPTEPPCESDPGLHADPVEPPRESGPVLHVAPTEPPHERDPVLHVASRDPPRQRDRGLHVDPTDPPLLRSPLSLQHDLHLTSVYSHFLPAKRHAEVTTLPMGRGASVDYIFYSAEPLLEGSTSHGVRFYEDKQLKLMGRLSLLSEADLWAAQGLPNPFCSSDHLCLLASFSLDLSAP